MTERTNEAAGHVIAVNIDYDEDRGKRSWDVETCSCDRPWRHGNAYLAGICLPPGLTTQPAANQEPGA